MKISTNNIRRISHLPWNVRTKEQKRDNKGSLFRNQQRERRENERKKSNV